VYEVRTEDAFGRNRILSAGVSEIEDLEIEG
jgi:hypothetical protein